MSSGRLMFPTDAFLWELALYKEIWHWRKVKSKGKWRNVERGGLQCRKRKRKKLKDFQSSTRWWGPGSYASTFSHTQTYTRTHICTHNNWVSSRVVECKQVSYGRECTISRSFPSRSSRPSSIIPPLSALPLRITKKRKGRGEKLSERLGKECRVWNWNSHSPYVASKLWLLPGRHFLFLPLHIPSGNIQAELNVHSRRECPHSPHRFTRGNY